MTYCYIKNCPHNDSQTDTCNKSDIAITEAGCLVYCQGAAAKSRPHPVADGRDAE